MAAKGAMRNQLLRALLLTMVYAALPTTPFGQGIPTRFGNIVMASPIPKGGSSITITSYETFQRDGVRTVAEETWTVPIGAPASQIADGNNYGMAEHDCGGEIEEDEGEAFENLLSAIIDLDSEDPFEHPCGEEVEESWILPVEGEISEAAQADRETPAEHPCGEEEAAPELKPEHDAESKSSEPASKPEAKQDTGSDTESKPQADHGSSHVEALTIQNAGDNMPSLAKRSPADAKVSKHTTDYDQQKSRPLRVKKVTFMG